MSPAEIQKTANTHLSLVEAAKTSTATPGQTNTHGVLRIILHALAFLFNLIVNQHVPPTPAADNSSQPNGPVGTASTNGAVTGSPDLSTSGAVAPAANGAVGNTEGSGTTPVV